MLIVWHIEGGRWGGGGGWPAFKLPNCIAERLMQEVQLGIAVTPQNLVMACFPAYSSTQKQQASTLHEPILTSPQNKIKCCMQTLHVMLTLHSSLDLVPT